jgi:phage internal scaffolding protein
MTKKSDSITLKINRQRGERCRKSTSFTSPSLTQQSQKSEACIHKMMDRYKLTGTLPQRSNFKYTGDALPPADDYHTAMNIITSTQFEFDSLPSNIRQKFGNDPAKMLQFLNEKSNYEEALALGLVNQRPDIPVEIPPISTPPVETPSSPEKAAS